MLKKLISMQTSRFLARRSLEKRLLLIVTHRPPVYRSPPPRSFGCASSSSVDDDTIRHWIAKGQLQEAQAALLFRKFSNQERPDAGTLTNLRGHQLHVLDAWLERQSGLLRAETTSSSRNNRDTNLDEIYQAAEAAHLMLESVAAILSHRGRNIILNSISISNHEQEEKEPPFPVTEVLPRATHVLAAWAAVCRAAYELLATKDKDQSVTSFSSRLLLRGIPQRAQFLLENMEVAGLSPSVDCYNSVLEAWAFSQEHLRGTMAERLFQRLLLLSSSSSSSSSPSSRRASANGESYQLIARAWALSNDKRAAFTATGHLMKMLRKLEKGNQDMEPSLEDYHVVLSAWTRAEDKMSPSKAHSVLKLMEYAYSQGVTEIRPDLVCYRAVLQTASQRPLLPDLGLLVDGILFQMNQRMFIPDSQCFRAAIRTWKQSALLYSTGSVNNNGHSTANPVSPDARIRERSVHRTLELLNEMKVAHNQSLLSDVSISTECVNDGLEALTVSVNPERFDQAERLLLELEQTMEKSQQQALSIGVGVGVGAGADSSPLPVPNFDSYRLALEVWRTSTSIEKVPRAMAILWRMKENYDFLSKDCSPRQKKQVVKVFNTFVRVCSSVDPRNDEEGMHVFREALAGVEGMRSLPGATPDAGSFASLLEACGKLLPLGKDRQKLVEQVFRMSCSDGMVDDNVLRTLREAATEDQYSRLVIMASELVEGTKMVPESWTKNSLGRRVVTAEGRRTTPLSVDGRLTVTMAMREFQMRRLRDHRNRNLLQGGRLRNRKHKETTVKGDAVG